ncbi:hypothetical protein BABINDRAFT_42170 [Babjeviella inositovora NRRL Y-12698]|uniref:U1-type domain-containing protein n=1 Tax=Babjeviella inositovora NRRL Y-12698 TaxID=984486 RepID=A0A1E3QI26_9ASCO|nr:uncharacterized protein BABINDRAFT_42170 [Babjeviella inositovora NRRL Y-12698]ODQ77094.1 hypothetical protein BABINDRAFT_42170 [Babjeviella inositovora NRRL Y-12698]
MDYSDRVNSKQGSGGVADSSLTNVHRRQRVAQLISSKINIDQDPYIFKNHLGLLECKLCLTTHVSEGSILSHMQGRKHQTNLQRRALKNGIDPNTGLPQTADNQNRPYNQYSLSQHVAPEKKTFIKVGKPSYKISKIRHPQTFQLGLLFQVNLPLIKAGTHPFHRFMSVYEQNMQINQKQAQINGNFQHLVVSAEPYENIAFRIPAKEIEKLDEKEGEKFWTYWDDDTKEYFVQFFYKD